MSYGLVDDMLHAHRKAAKAGLEAMGLWTMALSWSKARRTNGFIPADRPLLLAFGDPEAAARCVQALQRARLWVSVPGGWMFHDWHEYQAAGTTWSKVAYPEVIARDGMVCRYCLVALTAGKQQIDHVKPRCQGGGDGADNLVVACRGCNLRKNGRTPEQAGMELH